MTEHRANWKGHLKIGELSCAVGLYTAASTADRISFHMLNEKTGNRLKREFIDSETEKVVERDQQVKGFETGNGDYIMIDPEEVAAVVPESDKMLEAEAFIPCGDIDDVYFDKPYYLVPADDESNEAFANIRDALANTETTAIARTVLFRRMRTVLIRPHGKGLIATTLNFDYEVRPSDEAFKDVAKVKVEGEMLDLAKHIIDTKVGEFDPGKTDDRYETALAALVKAKAEGKALPKPKPIKVSKPNDLLKALRESAGIDKGSSKKPKAANANSGRKKASTATSSKATTKTNHKKAS
ncbi:Ku protein [Rhizobium leguminosarum]|uniref:non-homologous end joining protein Ku n=1 Tax=Rhizobium leguminosarum TaxID=384 RepID=UPI00103972CA|nr:Ku protein [Rhizobium leguminosarum]TBZ57998.1 Ku protein [Rhizobium leguminosarum bv. viciae]TCA82356.1 Ku protein [Rhizobium leguminosarum bv. viciae]TCA92819.1 Ku protein [Rhizobium leguminosarum bv. viciae]